MYSNSHFKYFKESKDYKSFYKQQKKFINTLSKIERDVLISFTKGYDRTYNGLNEDDIKLTNNTIGAEKRERDITWDIEKNTCHRIWSIII